jgi:Tfp pilus assembly protein FimV
MRDGATWCAVGSAVVLGFVDAQPAEAQTPGGNTKAASTKRSRPSAGPPASLGHTVRPGQTLWGIPESMGYPSRP